MRRKLLAKFMSIVLVSILIPLYVYANTLTLNINIDKEKVKVGDEIKVKVSWDKEMQAADFYLNYNSKKLEYINADIDDVFINNDTENGVVKTAWFSMDNTNKTDIEYTFKVKSGGKIKFTTTINGGFATEGLDVVEDYQEGELTIKILGNYEFQYIIIFIIITIILILILKGRRKIKENKTEVSKGGK